MEQVNEILNSTFGFSALRGKQQAVIKRLVEDGESACVVMPTG